MSGSIADHRPEAMGEPRVAAKRLREVFAAKVNGLISLGDIDPGQADELSRIAAAISRLEAGSYDLLTAAIEIMELFAEHAKAQLQGDDRIEIVGSLIDSFFKKLEG